MKKVLRIGSKFLAGYFLALPILFALHEFEHDHHKHHKDSNQSTQIEASDDCDLCDLIDLQVLSFDEGDQAIALTFIEDTAECQTILYLSSNDSILRLRGPPLC